MSTEPRKSRGLIARTLDLPGWHPHGLEWLPTGALEISTKIDGVQTTRPPFTPEQKQTIETAGKTAFPSADVVKVKMDPLDSMPHLILGVRNGESPEMQIYNFEVRARELLEKTINNAAHGYTFEYASIPYSSPLSVKLTK